MTNSSPGRGRIRRNTESNNLIPIRWLAAIALVTIVITTLLAIRFTDLTGSNDENGPVDLLSETGCFDMQLLPVDHEPDVSLADAEAAAREYLDEVGAPADAASEIDDDFEVGALDWSEYGELAPSPDGGEIVSGEAWVLVFEDAQEPSWLDRLRIQAREYRLSVIYRPDPGEVSRACGARVD